jgi:hypothetical protein
MPMARRCRAMRGRSRSLAWQRIQQFSPAGCGQLAHAVADMPQSVAVTCLAGRVEDRCGKRMMQAAEGRGYRVNLGIGGWPCSERLAGHAGHNYVGRIAVQVCPDGLGREPGRVACEQCQGLPLAARFPMRPVAEALDRSPLFENHAMCREGNRT